MGTMPTSGASFALIEKNCRDMSEKREEQQQKINQFSINRTKIFIEGTH